MDGTYGQPRERGVPIMAINVQAKKGVGDVLPLKAIVRAGDLASAIKKFMLDGSAPREIFLARHKDGLRLAKVYRGGMVWVDVPGYIRSSPGYGVWYGLDDYVLEYRISESRPGSPDEEIELLIDPSSSLLRVRRSGWHSGCGIRLAVLEHPHPEQALEHCTSRWVVPGRAAKLLRQAMGLPWDSADYPWLMLCRDLNRIGLIGTCGYSAARTWVTASIEASVLVNEPIDINLSVCGNLNRRFAWIAYRYGDADAMEVSMCKLPRKRATRLVVRCGPCGLMDIARLDTQNLELVFEDPYVLPASSVRSIVRALAAMEEKGIIEGDLTYVLELHGGCVIATTHIRKYHWDSSGIRPYSASLTVSVPAHDATSSKTCALLIPRVWAHVVGALCDVAGGGVIARAGRLKRSGTGGIEVTSALGWIKWRS